VVSSGEVAVAEAVARSVEKEPIRVVYKGPSSFVEAERIHVVNMAAIGSTSVDIVRQVHQEHKAQQPADAHIEARLIVAHARWEHQQRRMLPVWSAGTQQLQALDRDAEVEAFKVAIRRHRQQAGRAAPIKSMRLEDMSCCGARM
jgi:hypothetical protein